jgi:hypothetical protein
VAGELLKPVGIDLPLEPGLAQVSYFVGRRPSDARPSIGERIHEDRPGIYGLPTPGVANKLGFALVDRRHYFPAMRARPSTASCRPSSSSRYERTSPASGQSRSRPTSRRSPSPPTSSS